MEDYPQVDPEEMKRLDEKREKKLVRTRKNRLGHIQRHLMKMLKEISPEDFEKFEITYEPMTKYSGKGPAPSFRSSGYVSREHSPAYQFVLTQKDNPENRYKLMHLLKQDVDRNVRIADIPQHYQLLGFGKRKIPEGIEELRKKNEGGLESMPGIASIILIL